MTLQYGGHLGDMQAKASGSAVKTKTTLFGNLGSGLKENVPSSTSESSLRDLAGASPVKLGNSVLPSGPKDNVRSSTGSLAKRASLKDLNPLPVSNMRKLLFKMAIQKENNRGGNIR